MKTWRIWLVAVVAMIIILGHAFDIITQTEHWPFSFYPMYSRAVVKPKLTLLSLCAIVPDGTRFKLERLGDQRYVPQLDETRIRNILMSTWTTQPRAKAVPQISAIMRDYLKLYEARRIAGLHKGAPIRELQFCRMTWNLNSDGTRRAAAKVEPLLGLRANGKIIDYQPKPTTQPDEPGDE